MISHVFLLLFVVILHHWSPLIYTSSPHWISFFWWLVISSIFFVSVGHLYFFFVKYLHRSVSHFKIGLIFTLLLLFWVFHVSYLFLILILFQMYSLQVFSPILWLSLHSIDCTDPLVIFKFGCFLSIELNFLYILDVNTLPG